MSARSRRASWPSAPHVRRRISSLDEVDRVDIGIADVDRAAQHRVRLERLAVAGDASTARSPGEPVAQLRRAAAVRAGRAGDRIARRSRVGFREDHLDQIERRRKNGHRRTSSAAARRSPRSQRLLAARRRRRAMRRAAAGSASRRTATGSRAGTRRPLAPLRRAGRLPMLSAPARPPAWRRGSSRGSAGARRRRRDSAARRAASRSMRAPLGGRRLRRRERRVERRRRVDLQRAHGDVDQAELRLDHLALLGDAQAAVDRARRLRPDREVGRPAAAADTAAAAVEQRQLDAVPRGTRRRSPPARGRAPTRRAAGVLRRVGVADHHFLVPADARAIPRQPTAAVEHVAGAAQVVALFRTAGRRAAALRRRARFCSSSTASTSDARLRHRDDVGAERLGRQPRDRPKVSSTSLTSASASRSRRDQRPAALRAPQQELQPLRSLPTPRSEPRPSARGSRRAPGVPRRSPAGGRARTSVSPKRATRRRMSVSRPSAMTRCRCRRSER